MRICISHLQEIVAMGLAGEDEFTLIGDGVCMQCEAEDDWKRLTGRDRVHSREHDDGATIVVGDPRNTQLPSLMFQLGKTPRGVPPSAISLKWKQLRQAFEDAYPTAKERAAGCVPSNNSEPDLAPRIVRRKG